MRGRGRAPEHRGHATSTSVWCFSVRLLGNSESWSTLASVGGIDNATTWRDELEHIPVVDLEVVHGLDQSQALGGVAVRDGHRDAALLTRGEDVLGGVFREARSAIGVQEVVPGR
jgi:hypothetical protein